MNPKLMTSKQPATHSAKTAEPWQLAIRDERAVRELVGSVTDALAIAPTSWVPSFLGLPSSWGPAPYSEYQLLWSGDVPRLARYLVDVGIPSVPGRAPGWVPGPLASLFWHPSHVDRHPDENGQSDSHPHEAWFFINGILHDDALAQMNGDYLAYLFHRPITLLQNSTDGALVDLLECAVERLGATAEDVDAAFPPLMKALKDPEKERVVVIAHSQGTLILAVVLELIKHIYARTTSNQLSNADVDAIHRRTRAEGMQFDRRHIKPLNARELGSAAVRASRPAGAGPPAGDAKFPCLRRQATPSGVTTASTATSVITPAVILPIRRGTAAGIPRPGPQRARRSARDEGGELPVAGRHVEALHL